MKKNQIENGRGGVKGCTNFEIKGRGGGGGGIVFFPLEKFNFDTRRIIEWMSEKYRFFSGAGFFSPSEAESESVLNLPWKKKEQIFVEKHKHKRAKVPFLLEVAATQPSEWPAYLSWEEK